MSIVVRHGTKIKDILSSSKDKKHVQFSISFSPYYSSFFQCNFEAAEKRLVIATFCAIQFTFG